MKQGVLFLLLAILLGCTGNKRVDNSPIVEVTDSVLVATGYDEVELFKTRTGHITATLSVNGKEVKRVTSTDDGTVEDPEQENGSGNGENGGSSQEGGNTNQGGNTGDNSGSQSENGDNGQSQQSSYNLTIARSGSGTSTVTDDSENVITGQRRFAPGTNLNIEIVPAEGQIPTATINHNSIELTENDGTYSGSFQMPAQGSVLELNSGSNGDDGGADLDKD